MPRPPGSTIDLVLIFVAPIHDFGLGEIGAESVEDNVLPEQAAVFRAEIGPAAGESGEAGVEAIDLGPADQLALSTAGIGRMKASTWVRSRTSS